MLDSTWAGKKLKGFRHLPPADRSAVVDVLVRLSYLALELPQIIELEINPVRVLPAGGGRFRARYPREAVDESPRTTWDPPQN